MNRNRIDHVVDGNTVEGHLAAIAELVRQRTTGDEHDYEALMFAIRDEYLDEHVTDAHLRALIENEDY